MAYCRNFMQPRIRFQKIRLSESKTEIAQQIQPQQPQPQQPQQKKSLFSMNLELPKLENEFPIGILVQILKNCLETVMLALKERDTFRYQLKQAMQETSNQNLLQNLPVMLQEKKIEIERLTCNQKKKNI